jgi:hypothetical protein
MTIHREPDVRWPGPMDLIYLIVLVLLLIVLLRAVGLAV